MAWHQRLDAKLLSSFVGHASNAGLLAIAADRSVKTIVDRLRVQQRVDESLAVADRECELAVLLDCDARRRRRLPMAVVAKRAFTSRSTLQKVEAGNANVSIGIYAADLQALGLLDGLGEIADIARDSVGQALASAELPKRVRLMCTPEPIDHG